MSWVWLTLAIGCEVPGTIAMKVSAGFTKPIPSLVMIVCYVFALGFVNLALKEIPLSIAYTIWAGVGTTLVALIGIFLFHEPATALKIGSIALVVAGVVGLKSSM
jgi:small multidrug resistance pump